MNTLESTIPVIEVGIETSRGDSQPYEDYRHFYGLASPAPRQKSQILQISPSQPSAPRAQKTSDISEPTLKLRTSSMAKSSLESKDYPLKQLNQGQQDKVPETGPAKSKINAESVYKYRVALERCKLCGGLDFRNLAVCVTCGFDKRSLLARGKYKIFLGANNNLQDVKAFLTQHFPGVSLSSRVLRKKQTLASHVSSSMVHFLLGKAQNAGLVFEVREISPQTKPWRDLWRLSALIVGIVFGLTCENILFLGLSLPLMLMTIYGRWVKQQIATSILTNLAADFRLPQFMLKNTNLSYVFKSQKISRRKKDDVCQMIMQYFHLQSFLRHDNPYNIRHLEKMLDHFSGLAMRVQYVTDDMEKHPEKKASLSAVVAECQRKQNQIRHIFAGMMNKSASEQAIFGSEEFKKIRALEL